VAELSGPVDLGPARVAELDHGDMLGAIASLPRQLREGYEAARERLAGAFFGTFPAIPPAEPDGLAVCGMGGSAIGADLVLACLPDLPVASAVVRGYQLPAWVGPGTLVVVVSYSGETEEALACASEARRRGCAPVCVASGGRLAAFAEAEGLPSVLVPGGGQPRASVGALSVPLLATIEAAGLCHEHAGDVAGAAAQLEADNAALGPESADRDNPAKSLARRLERRLLVAYGAGATAPVARRWKGQVNENAKAPAFFNELPELDHNELMGWTSQPHVSSLTTAVFLDDGQSDERLTRRVALTAGEYEALGLGTELVTARGDSRLARLFSLVQLGDYVSFYLALFYGVDPTPVTAIQDFKAKLAGA
jgi:glucose/mannose-6-phosphate isomerase